MVSIKVKFIPLGDRIVIMPLEREQTTKGGIYLPDTAKEKPQVGEVIDLLQVRWHGVQGRRRGIPNPARK